MIKPSASYRLDAMNRLQSSLFQNEITTQSRVVQITSSHFGEGVTSVTLGLAACIAGMFGSDSIVVVEANLRKPSLHERLRTIPLISMANLLERGYGALDAVVKIENYGFSVLPAGATPIEGLCEAVEANLRKPPFNEGLRTIPSIPMVSHLERGYGALDAVIKIENYGFSFLPAGATPIERRYTGSRSCMENLGKLVDELKSRYQFILLDSPPVIPFLDSEIVALFSDSVVIVVEANVTTAEVLEITTNRLKAVAANIAGIVLNKRDLNIPKWLFRFI